MSADRAGARRLAGMLLLALASLGATRGSCPMFLAPQTDEASAHGCCGEGLASTPPGCCDDGARTPDVRTREDASPLTEPAARALLHETLAALEGSPFSVLATPLVVVHGPPHSILRI